MRSRENGMGWTGNPFHHALVLCLIGGVSALVAAVGAAALGSAAGFPALPEPLAQIDERLPGIFRLHMIAGGLGLVLLPWPILLRHHGHAHRALGRAALGLLFLAALTALPSAAASVAPPMARAGFLTQGAFTLYFLTAGLKAIQRKDRQSHRRSMLCAASLVSGAIVLRLMLYCAVRLDLDLVPAYAAIAWFSWGIPLAATVLLAGARPQRGETGF
jgi:hypothetical protein